MALVDQRRMTCDDLANRCIAAANRLVERKKQGLASIAASLQALSPLSVLSRGYSLTQTEAGRIVRDPSVLQSGDRITTRVAGGLIRSIVDGVEQ